MNELITEEHICNAIFNSCDVSRCGRVLVSTLIEEIYEAVSSPEVSALMYNAYSFFLNFSFMK